MKENKRIIYLDFLRVIACFMVVVMHSPMATDAAQNNGMFLSSLSYFTAPCIGLLFMISGALLLPVPDRYDTMSFLKKRLSRVLGPTLFWSIFYLLLNVDVIGEDMVKSILSIPFSAQGHGILWFMYTLIGLYLLAPILGCWLRNVTQRELLFYLSLWGISLCYPLLAPILKTEESTTGILYYFSGYAGYFLLGYYLKHYGSSIKYKSVLLAFGLAASAPIVVKLLGWKVDFYRVFWYLSVFVVMMCVFWWRIVERYVARSHFSNGWTHFIIGLSNLTFGIYLSHIFIMRHLLWHIEAISLINDYKVQTLIIALLTFVIAGLLSMMLSCLPFGDYIIGYKRISK